MAIRNSAKAIVINHGKILLNRCTSRFGEYYALPGGGQNPGETLQEAVQRELLEETGYRVKPLRLSGIYESVADRTGTEDGCLCHKITNRTGTKHGNVHSFHITNLLYSVNCNSQWLDHCTFFI